MEYNKIRKLILGKTGSGKSFLLKKFIENYYNSGLNRIIIFDVHSEYIFNQGIIFYSLKNFIRYYNNFHYSDKFIFIFRFTEISDYLVYLENYNKIKNYLLCIDETSFFVRKNNEQIQKILRFSRHYNIGLIGVSRRFYELSKEFRALIYDVISFKQTEPKDIEELKKFGFKKIETLKTYEYEQVIL